MAMNHPEPQPPFPTPAEEGVRGGAWPAPWGHLPWQSLLEGMGDGLWDWDMVTDHVHYSPRFQQLLGYADSRVFDTQFSFRSHLHPDDAPAALRLLHAHVRGGTAVFEYEYRLRCQSGEYRWFRGRGQVVRNASGQALGFAGHLTDVTDRVQAQAAQRALDDRQRQSQQRLAMGNLAAGLARAFGQVLDSMNDGLARAQRELPAPHPALGPLAVVAQAGERAQALVQQCLVFSRRQPQRLTVLDLGGLAAQCVATARTLAPEGATLRHTLPPEPVQVLADAAQLQQAILTLCTHAIQALGGRVGEVHVAVGPGANGTGAEVVVHDTGPGTLAEDVDRLFEPFCQPHSAGSAAGSAQDGWHSGWGLAVAQGIAQAHQGHITVSSQAGQGTRVALWLPRLTTPLSAPPAVVPSAPDVPDPRANPVDASGIKASRAAAGPLKATRASGAARVPHVVYVDDDEAMVYLVTRMLQKRGSRVSSFERAEQALAFIEAHPQDMDLLVTDYNMPGFSGLDVVRRVKLCRPDVPMVITSGHITPGMLAESLTEGVCQVLSKQDSVEDLVAILAGLLDSLPPRG